MDCGVLALTVLLLVTGWLCLDLAAAISLVALALGGILIVEEALAGSASGVEVAVASLLIIGEGR